MLVFTGERLHLRIQFSIESMTSCIVCENDSLTPIYNETLLRCPTCSHVTANMEIDAEILKEVYSENYFKGEEYADYLNDKPILQTNFEKRLDSLRKLNTPPELTHVLEIGCAYGFFGEVLNNRISNTSYIGIDVVHEAIEYGQKELKQNLICGDYLTLPAPEKPYSDVFMWDVIEHLPHPELFIQKIAAETASGSRMYITTGDIGAFLPRMQKANWRMIHPPSHLHYFTAQSIRTLLAKYGFKTERITYPPVSRSIKVIFFSLFLLNKKPGRLTRKLYEAIPEKASVSLNTRDIMFVVAQKE